MFFSAPLIFACYCAVARGHGRLLNPPSRASKWRVGYTVPVTNYDDNQGYCGGFDAQYLNFSGKCGVCGDAWRPRPRQHELGGKYYTNGITRTWRSGHVITAEIHVTANHRGWFEFRLCKYDDPVEGDIERAENGEFIEVSQACLDRHILSLADHNSTRHHLTSPYRNGLHKIDLRLPPQLTCKKCLFQWHWTVANSWGESKDGTACVGCGEQETFAACADVQIVDGPAKGDAGGDVDVTQHGDDDVQSFAAKFGGNCRFLFGFLCVQITILLTNPIL